MSGSRAESSAATTTIALAIIRTDGGTQSRASIHQNVVDEYAEAIANGVIFPPVVLFYDGTDYWLGDGFHRHAAFMQAGAAQVPVDMRQGTRRDAILYSVGANEAHGLRRTNEDKRRTVTTLLSDAEWSTWSDRDIARQCVVTHPFVSKLRELTGNVTSERAYKTKHGTVATMETSAIGKKPAVSPSSVESAAVAPMLAPETAAVTRIAKNGKQGRSVSQDGFKQAAHLIGVVKRFSEFCGANPPESVAGDGLQHEVAGLRADVRAAYAWLKRLDVMLAASADKSRKAGVFEDAVAQVTITQVTGSHADMPDLPDFLRRGTPHIEAEETTN